MVAATVSAATLELAVLGALAVGVLFGIVVGWQTRSQIENSRRGGDVDLTGRRPS